MELEIKRQIIKWGNSAGILLPKEHVGKEAKIIIIDRTSKIKKEVFDILEPYLEDIIGIYLVGSHARNEVEEDSDIDILAISEKKSLSFTSGIYSISVYTLNGIKNMINKRPERVLPMILEAKPILNSSLLNILKESKLQKSSLKEFFQETKRITKINQSYINLQKEFNKKMPSNVIYSIILRLRALFMVRCLINNRNYTKKEFYSFLSKELSNEEFEKSLVFYKSVRDNKKIKTPIPLDLAQKLLDFLEKEVKNEQ